MFNLIDILLAIDLLLLLTVIPFLCVIVAAQRRRIHQLSDQIIENEHPRDLLSMCGDSGNRRYTLNVRGAR